MRFWLGLTSLAIVAAATPSVARAELGGGKLKVEIKIPADPEMDAGSRNETDYIDPATDYDRTRYFNFARCQCDSLVADQLYHVRVSWETQPTMPVTGQLFLWTGTGCAAITDPQQRPTSCNELVPINDVNDVTSEMVIKRFEYVSELVSPGTNTDGCVDTVTQTAFGVFSSSDGNALTEETIVPIMPIDMKPPVVPATVTASGEEGQITLSWDRITSGVEDYEFFQALCSAGGDVAHATPKDDPQYDTTKRVCGLDVTQFDALTLENADDLPGTPIAFGDLPSEMAQLDESFICGQANGAASSITLGDLANGVEYTVVLVAMDKAGNYSAGFVPKTITPQPVTDFWEDANEDYDGIEGGLCLVESTYGAGGGGLNGMLRAWRDELRQTAAGRWLVERYYAWGAPLAAAARESVIARVVIGIAMLPLVVIALVWHAIGLPALLAIALALVVLRRRRKLVVTAAIALAPSLAAAQSMTPYWDDELASESAETSGPKWRFGLRIGPYTPSIDDERFMDPGPYERNFGSGSWVPAADLHRLFGTRFGQFGAGVTVGFFSKTADALIPGTDLRAEGNENSLKIVPMELTAIWRASMLHDNWGIPLVPYLRGGAAYYLWWVRRPDGDLAKACPPNMTNCDRAIGASMGLVGAAGLSIRAEGVDPDAARSMRDSGLDHAGFYAEVEMAWVDGFGNDKKLSLGDTTWFAGIDFEF